MEVLSRLHSTERLPTYPTRPRDRDYVALAKGFPALALMSEGDLSEDFGPFASALQGALDPIVTDFRQQMVRIRTTAWAWYEYV